MGDQPLGNSDISFSDTPTPAPVDTGGADVGVAQPVDFAAGANDTLSQPADPGGLDAASVSSDPTQFNSILNSNPQYSKDWAAYDAGATNALNTAGMKNVGVQVDSAGSPVLDANGNPTFVDISSGQPLAPGSSLYNSAAGLLQSAGALAGSGLGQALLKAGLGTAALTMAGKVAGVPTFQTPTAVTAKVGTETPPQVGAVPGPPPLPTLTPPAPGQVPTFQTPTAAPVPLAAPVPVMTAPTTTIAGLAGEMRTAGTPGGVAMQQPASTPASQNLQMGSGALTTALQSGGQASLATGVNAGLAARGTAGQILQGQAGLAKESLAANAPTALGVQSTAYKTIAQNQGNPNALQDPIEAGINEQIQRVLNGQYSNPALEAKMAHDNMVFQQEMENQLGPGWQTSTAGQYAQEQQNLYESSVREQDKQSVVQNYSTIAQQRRQFNVTNPQQEAQALVTQNTPLTTLGLNPSVAAGIATASNTVAPTTEALTNIPGQLASQARADQAALVAAQTTAQDMTAAGHDAATASIAAAQSYNNALLQAGLSQDEANRMAAQYNFQAMTTSMNFTNQASLAAMNAQNTANLTGAQANMGAQVQGTFAPYQAGVQQTNTLQQGQIGSVTQQNQINENAVRDTFNLTGQANLQGATAQNNANLTGARSNFNAAVPAATTVSKGIGDIAGTLASGISNALAPTPAAPAPAAPALSITPQPAADLTGSTPFSTQPSQDTVLPQAA